MSGQLVGYWPWQWIVSPLAGDTIGARHDTPIHTNSPTRTRAENNAEYIAGTSSSAVGGFGQGKTIGVILDQNLATKQCLQIIH